MLTNSSTMLEELYMFHTMLTPSAAIALFTALKDNKTLKKLIISHNSIGDDACYAIATALTSNSCLATLYMSHNPLTEEAIVNIVSSLKVNNTLAELWLPKHSVDVKQRIVSLQKIINEERKIRGCQLKCKINFW